MLRRRCILVLGALAGAGAAVVPGGCASSAGPAVQRDAAGVEWGSGAEAGEGALGHSAVFQNPAVTAALGGGEDGPEFGRRDGQLAVGMGSAGPLLATGQWPVEARPQLDDLRVVYLPTYTSTSFLPVTYFGPGYWARPRRGY